MHRKLVSHGWSSDSTFPTHIGMVTISTGPNMSYIVFFDVNVKPFGLSAVVNDQLRLVFARQAFLSDKQSLINLNQNAIFSVGTGGYIMEKHRLMHQGLNGDIPPYASSY